MKSRETVVNCNISQIKVNHKNNPLIGNRLFKKVITIQAEHIYAPENHNVSQCNRFNNTLVGCGGVTTLSLPGNQSTRSHLMMDPDQWMDTLCRPCVTLL